MSNEVDALARVYAFILSDKWGCDNLAKNTDADPAAVNDQDRQLTVMVSPPCTRPIIPDKRDAGEDAGNDIHRVGEPESFTPVDSIIPKVTGKEGISKETE